MNPLVIKFGGTSVGSAPAISAAVAITREQARETGGVVCVVSAMSGVTDRLLRGARSAAAGDRTTFGEMAQALSLQHRAATEALLNGERAAVDAEIETLIAEFESLCHCVNVLGEASPRVLDAVGGLGERMSARLVAAAIRAQGTPAEAVDATELILTDGRFGDAVPLVAETRERSRARLLPLLAAGTVPVVTGFIGATRDGALATLGRGGSDFSAAILGAALDAPAVWIYTDVDGVMTADPRQAPEAHVIPVLSYSEMSELAYFGAKVLHPRTIRPAVEACIPLRIRNTFNPAHPGTLVTAQAERTPGTIKAVTAVGNLSLVAVEGSGMMGVPGIAARTFAAVANVGANVLMISQASSEQSICFVVPSAAAPGVVAAIHEALALELHRRDVERVSAQDGIVIISTVGAGMRGTPGVASRIFGALGEGAINVIAIAQGSSECSVSIVVDAVDASRAVEVLHALTRNGEAQRRQMGSGQIGSAAHIKPTPYAESTAHLPTAHLPTAHLPPLPERSH